MKNLTSRISLAVIAILATGMFLAVAPRAQATPPSVANLVVEFQSAPLFEDGDIKPCHEVTKFIKVTNNSGQTQPIVIQATNFTDPADPEDLSHALMIVIKKDGADIYGPKTLAEFYQNGETFLSDLDTGLTAQYDITISFSCDKGNEWQGKTTGFNLEIGFQSQTSPTPTPSPPTTPLPSPSGGPNAVAVGGGGGMGGNGPLPPSDAYQSWLLQQAPPGEVKGESTGFVSDQPAGEVLGASTFKGAALAGTGFSLWEFGAIAAFILILIGLRLMLKRYNKTLESS